MGLSTIGAVEVPVNTAYRGGIFEHIINNSEARCMLIDREFLDRVGAVEEKLTYLKKVIVFSEEGFELDELPEMKFEVLPYRELLDNVANPPEVEVNYYDLVAIMYTSGTTGPSKGVKVTYRHAYQYATGQLENQVVIPGRRHYCCLPIFHILAQWYDCYAAFLANTSVAIVRRFSVKNFWQDIRKYNCGSTSMLGAMANFIYNQPPHPDDADTPLVRIHMTPLPPDLEGFKNRFGVKLSTVYGSTESGIPTLTDDPKDIKSCGRVRDGFDLRIVNEFDEEVPIGQPGELILRHRDPCASIVGYYNMPEKNEEAFRNLWFHTGDMLYKDEEGNYYFVDRIKDAIRVRGENVSSFEVEKEINSHPAVLESAVVAVKSKYTEDEIKAVIVLREGSQLTPKELIRYLEPRMPYFMIPKYIEFKASFQKTPTEKIKKEILRAEGITETVWDREKAGIEIKH
jgi:crotonobetaine/carnitine-CoA ligase